ncbi:hypothetical protein AHiyo8_16350 [Arthrobacter sp. Hiyo8]|nr:hypothetical protein AHiyo8_16350 [Arthrobacter sp. Hiyo8]
MVVDDHAALLAEFEQPFNGGAVRGAFRSRNSSSRGRMPMDAITMSAGMTRPSFMRTPVTWPSSDNTSAG